MNKLMPPTRLNPTAREAWLELEAASPYALTIQNSAILEIAASLLGMFRESPTEFSPARLAQLRLSLKDLGLSPKELKITAPLKENIWEGLLEEGASRK